MTGPGDPAHHQQPADHPVATGPEPYPGQQYPAAVLPGSEPFPSGPMPAVTFPQSEPLPSGPMPAVTFPQSEPLPAQAPPTLYQPAPPKPRNKTVITLTIVAAFLFLASGALGTLWLVEQGDHKGTSSELQTVKENLAKSRDELKTAQDEASKSTIDRQRTMRDMETSRPCLEAAKAYIRALSEAEAEKFWGAMNKVC